MGRGVLDNLQLNFLLIGGAVFPPIWWPWDGTGQKFLIFILSCELIVYFGYQPLLSATSSIQHPASAPRHTTLAGVCKAVVCTMCEILSFVLPSTDRLLCFPPISQRSHPPSWFLHYVKWAFSECGNLSYVILLGVLVPSPFLFFSFLLPSCMGILSWGLPLVFRGCFMRTVLFSDVCLICTEANSASSIPVLMTPSFCPLSILFLMIYFP